MKSVLISIQPKWCELIANGGKTIEVRKTKPKIDTPFKCYIYETKAPKLKYVWTKKDYEGYPWFEGMDENEKVFCKLPQGRGKVIGEFVCDSITEFYPTMELKQLNSLHFQMCDKSCVNMADLYNYANGKMLYGWHISDLVIYDKPKELSEFFIDCGHNPKCDGCEMRYYTYCRSIIDGHRPLTRPPQSWCYVEEGGEAHE